MLTDAHRTARLGDLIVAAFDVAECKSANPRVVASLATKAVARMLGSATSPRFLATRPNAPLKGHASILRTAEGNVISPVT